MILMKLGVKFDGWVQEKFCDAAFFVTRVLSVTILALPGSALALPALLSFRHR